MALQLEVRPLINDGRQIGPQSLKRIVLGAALSLTLSACEQTGFRPSDYLSSERTPADLAPVEDRSTNAPAANERVLPETPDKLAALPPARGVRTAVATQLTGLSTDQVIAKLGEPDVRRREAAAQFWHYAGRDCILYLFVFVEPGKTIATVRYAEVRDPKTFSIRANGSCTLNPKKA